MTISGIERGVCKTAGRMPALSYRARASTRVTSSGCSLSPIQSSTAMVTIWLIWGRGKVAVVADEVDQALLAEFAEIIFRLGDAVAVGQEDFAGMHFDRAFVVGHVVEQAHDRATGFEPADGAVFADQRSEAGVRRCCR